MSLTFQEFIDSQKRFLVYLVKLRPYKKYTGFSLVSGAIYKKSIPEKIVHVRVNLNGLSAGSSASLNAGEYYYDSATSELYIRLSDGSNPSGSDIYAYHFMYFSTRYDPQMNDPDNNYWHEQIKEVPTVARGRSETLSKMTITIGSLRFYNGNEFWKDYWNDLFLDLIEFEIIITGFVLKDTDRTEDWLPWANKKTILKGLCKRSKYNDDEVIFKLGEPIDFFETTFPLTEYTTSVYPNLDPNAVGRFIHRGYGIVKGIEAVQVNTSNYTYKFDDQAITSIQAVYDEDGATLSTSSQNLTNAEIVLSSSTTKSVFVDYTKNVGSSPYNRAGDIKNEILTNVLQVDSSAIDSASYTGLNTSRNYALGISIDSRLTIQTIFEDINASVLAEDNINRDGQFTTKAIAKPSSSDANQQEYTDYLNITGEPTFEISIDSIANRILIGYSKNNSISGEGIQYKYASTDALGNDYEIIKVITIPTLLTNETDALAVGALYVPFLNSPENKIKLKTDLKPYSQWIGETFKYDRPSAGDGPTGAGAYWKILRIRENYQTGETEIIGVN